MSYTSDNTGIIFSSFDLLHAGHIALLQECKTKCGWLIVALQTDPTIDRPDTKNRPVQTTFERWTQLQALDCVDQIIPYDTEDDLLNMLSILKINKRFIGSEYHGQYIHGQDLCEALGIEIVYINRIHKYSTTELRKRIEDAGRRV
jgi:glycerol-3-phosphate cytidylyltransferase